jgi:hypothetical protein
MAAHIGVTNLDGHTAPALGGVQSRESDISIGTVKERNAAGVTKWFVPDKYFVKRVTITGVGDAELALVVADTIAAGTLGIVSAKQMEYNKGLPKFERVGVLADNIAA